MDYYPTANYQYGFVKGGRPGLMRSNTYRTQHPTHLRAHFECPSDCAGQTVKAWRTLSDLEAEAQKRADKLARDKDRLRSEREDLRSDLRAKDTEIADLYSQIKDLRMSVDTADSFRNRLSDLAAEKHQLQDRKKYYEKRVITITETNERQYRENESLRSEIDRLKTQNGKLRADVSHWRKLYHSVQDMFSPPSASHHHHSYNRSYSYA